MVERKEDAQVEQEEEGGGQIGQQRAAGLEPLGHGQGAVLQPPALRLDGGRLGHRVAQQPAEQLDDFVVVARQLVEVDGVLEQALGLRVARHQFDDFLHVHLRALEVVEEAQRPAAVRLQFAQQQVEVARLEHQLADAGREQRVALGALDSPAAET